MLMKQLVDVEAPVCDPQRSGDLADEFTFYMAYGGEGLQEREGFESLRYS